MTDIFWDRVEPHTRSTEMEEGLQARIADPLWMLARQWQLGEFRGEDAASPIHARLKVTWSTLKTFRNDASPGGAVESIRSGMPLEARVEAEAAADGPARLALAAEAGLQFLRRLDGAGLGTLRPTFRSEFPLVVATSSLEGLPERERLRLQLLGRRAIDGRELLAAGAAHIAKLVGSSTDPATVEPLYEAWRGEVEARLEEPGPQGDTWADERLEYSFSIGASTGEGEVVLSAPQYPGGHLDWHSFDIDTRAEFTHGLPSRTPPSRTLELLPVPLAYAGMPASRWWELEEGAVYFGGIEAGPADIGRLVVAEYATICSDDWFLLPVRLPVGSLSRILGVTVVDTFGEVHEISSTAVLDSDGGKKKRPWRFFELATDPSADEERTPWLLLPPALVAPLNGRPVEEVSFLRDEDANLGWAVESTIESPTGRPLRRRLQSGLAQQAAAEAAPPPKPRTPEDSQPWRYRLQTRVPPYWIPLVPEPIEPGSAQMKLRRARLLAWDQIEQDWAKGPKGQVLTPSRPLRLHEEEVPRGGVQVTRAWQLARASDGTPHLWMARRKRPGRGERGSGLAYDTMER